MITDINIQFNKYNDITNKTLYIVSDYTYKELYIKQGNNISIGDKKNTYNKFKNNTLLLIDEYDSAIFPEYTTLNIINKSENVFLSIHDSLCYHTFKILIEKIITKNNNDINVNNLKELFEEIKEDKTKLIEE